MSTPDRPAPLRILIGCDTFLPDVNGAARFAERLAAGLVRRGEDVHVVAPATRRGRDGSFVETIEGEQMTLHRSAKLALVPPRLAALRAAMARAQLFAQASPIRFSLT